jgi:16S rRNA (guanine966-N2)-methyltransferase
VNRPRAVAGRLRIIAGRWRGRRVPALDLAELRPTPNRVRETLFNWLQPVLEGARCLDLFAGSGLLGLEALSRGAASCVAVECQPRAIAGLVAVREALGADALEIVRSDAFAFLEKSHGGFDIVFVDPPFRRPWLAPVVTLLARPGWLRRPAWIYLEASQPLDVEGLPGGLREYRAGRAGEVSYQLLRHE